MFDMRGLQAVTSYIQRAASNPAIREAHLLGEDAVAELERKLASAYRCRYALCVSNATVGLLAVGLALKLRDAEFIAPAYTYGASLSGWLILGNRPRFVDVDPQTLTLEPTATARAITPATRAILAVDIYGNPSDSQALRRIADDHGLWYVADAAQSLGASRNEQPASSAAHAIVTSFTVGKTVQVGEGGAIITDDVDLFRRLVWFTQHPARQRRDLGLHLANEFGLNGRIHPLAAVWANAVFEESLRALAIRQRAMFEAVTAVNGIGLTEPILFEKLNIKPSFFRLTAEWTADSLPRELEWALTARGLAATIHRAPVMPAYQQSVFQTQFRGLPASEPCPFTERATQRRFTITLDACAESVGWNYS
jgi:perosamine synthetase